MKKVFLSHRSKDKYIVDNVAKKLGANFIHYDAMSFEISAETYREIYSRIDNSDVFIYFISKNTFLFEGEIDWVKLEFEYAESLYHKNNLKGFLPIVIDKDITYKDTRIPLWIREKYNLQYIGSWDKIVRIIKSKILENICEIYPDVKQKYQRFTGRNQYIEEVEKALFSQISTPVAIIASGFERIGRKSILFHSLIKSGLINNYVTQPANIDMFRGQGIDDFIIKFSELGYFEKIYTATTLPPKYEDKVHLLSDLALELNRIKDVVVINDYGSIINTTNELSDWFNDFIKSIYVNSTLFLIATQFKLNNYHSLNRAYQMYYLHVRPFDSDDKIKLLNKMLYEKQITLDAEQKMTLLKLFTGFPEQIIRTVEILSEHNYEWLLKNSYQIVEYNTDFISRVVNTLNEEELSFLRFLSEFECIGFVTLNELIGIENISSMLEKFNSLGICIFTGAQNELIQIENVVRDYIKRKQRMIDERYEKYINEIIKRFIEQEDNINISEYYVGATYYVLRKDYSIEKHKKVLPSTYIKAIIELYSKTRNKYIDVVNLAFSVLANVELDRIQEAEIRYWLCMALAKCRDARFHEEAMKIHGAEHNYIFGFYYRIIGNNLEAEKRLLKALDERKSFSRAKTELVHVYMNMEEFDKAESLAKDLYEQSPNNPYSINAYFTTMIRLQHFDDRVLLQRLIDKLLEIGSTISKEMYYNCQAQFYAFVNNDMTNGLKMVERGISESEKTIYLQLTEVEILIRFKQYQIANDKLNIIIKEDYSKSYLNNTIMIKKAQILAGLGNKNEGKLVIDELRYLPDNVKNKLKTKYSIN